MKIRHIIAIVAVIIVTNTAFGSISNALKKSDYHHCRVTTHMTAQECENVTGYTVAK